MRPVKGAKVGMVSIRSNDRDAAIMRSKYGLGQSFLISPREYPLVVFGKAVEIVFGDVGWVYVQEIARLCFIYTFFKITVPKRGGL